MCTGDEGRPQQSDGERIRDRTTQRLDGFCSGSPVPIDVTHLRAILYCASFIQDTERHAIMNNGAAEYAV